MAQNTGVDYFSHRGSFEATVEDPTPVTTSDRTITSKSSEDEGLSKATLPNPLYTPPPPSTLSPSSQMTVVEEESLASTPRKDKPGSELQTPLSEDGFYDTAHRDRNASPTPKLQIVTNLRSGSFSISSQTTPYSDNTLFSTSDTAPSPTRKIKVENTSPQNRPRSNSEPAKAFRPPLPENTLPKDKPDPRTLMPQSSIPPQSAISQSATPMVSRTPSRRKFNAFVAHNPFRAHGHADVISKEVKRDLTFDEIRTPVSHLNPRVTFASGNEVSVEGAEYPPSRDRFTPVGPYQYSAHARLGRSLSQATDLRRNDLSNRPSIGSRRHSSLRVRTTLQNHLDRRDSVRSTNSVVSEDTEESTVDEHQSIGQDSHSDTQKSPYPTNRRRNAFAFGHEDNPYEEEIDSIPRSSLLRRGTIDPHAAYSTHDDMEKNSIETSENTKTHATKTPGFLFRLWRSKSASSVTTTESNEAFAAVAVTFVAGTLPRQLYLHLLFRLPLLYFSRVSRIFEEADLTLPELKRMALETPQSVNKLKLNRIDLSDLEASDVPLEYQSLSATWEFFIDSLLREWKIINIISGLLLSAILTLLQIDSAAENPFIRFTALFSLICSLISLLYGCMYIIRFGTMRKPYKAAEWALEARKKTMVWWNVWVLLAMPAIWLTWSIILYIVCIMAFAWQTTSQVDTPPPPLSPNTLLGVRVLLTGVLGVGVAYGILIITTFSRYGEVMDRTWKERIDEWAEEKTAAASTAVQPEYSPSHEFADDQETYAPDHHPNAAALRTPTSGPSSTYVGPTPNHDGHPIDLPPPHDHTGANLGKKSSIAKEKRRVRFQSPRNSPAESLGNPIPFDADNEGSEAHEQEATADTLTPSLEHGE